MKLFFYSTLLPILAYSSLSLSVLELTNNTEADSKKLIKSWEEEVYSPDQLKQLRDFKNTFTPEQRNNFGIRWGILTQKVRENLDKDPCSDIGQLLIKDWMDLVDEMYGNYPELRDATNLAYKNNKIPHSPYDADLWNFLEKASIYMSNQK